MGGVGGAESGAFELGAPLSKLQILWNEKISENPVAGFVACLMLGIFFYGIIRFPDGPIRMVDKNLYQGKQGQTHTLEDFQKYKNWETSVTIVWPIGMLSLAFLKNCKKRSE